MPQRQSILKLALLACIMVGVLAALATFTPVGADTADTLESALLLGVVCIGFLTWFWLLSVYPASRMASFGFLAPLFGVFFGWLILDEHLSLLTMVALVLVGTGIVLVNRTPTK